MNGITNIIPANTAKTHAGRKSMDEVRDWFGTFEVKLTEAHRESLNIFFQSIVEYTPKKTGYASYNWRYSSTGKLNNYLEPRVEQEHFYSGRTVAPPDFSTVKWNNNSVIYNFVPYIEKLNNGYSIQHPHFFEHAEANARTYLESMLRRI